MEQSPEPDPQSHAELTFGKDAVVKPNYTPLTKYTPKHKDAKTAKLKGWGKICRIKLIKRNHRQLY